MLLPAFCFQWVLYRGGQRAHRACGVQHRDPHQHDALQGGLRGVCGPRPGQPVRRLETVRGDRPRLGRHAAHIRGTECSLNARLQGYSQRYQGTLNYTVS